jgi:hypothetical protein
MDRRDFLKLASCVGLTVVSPTAFGGGQGVLTSPPRKSYEPYTGNLFVSVNAGGGWDPTSLCDPKGWSSPNDPNPMNHYDPGEIGQAGNILYAPTPVDAMGVPVPYMQGLTPQEFFDKYYQQLTVINGLDVQTNGHDTGARVTWSGRLAEGFPTLSAFVAGAYGPQQPIAFLSFGGFAETAGIVARTRAGNPQALGNIAYPQRRDPGDELSTFHAPKVQEMIDAQQFARDQSLMAKQNLPNIKHAMGTLFTARTGSNELKLLQQYLPDPLSGDFLESQAQIAIAAYRAGICVAVNMDLGGFDTHGDHDASHIPQLYRLLGGVDFLMEEAERQGVGGKVVVSVGSDFGRTPGYNDGNGKDHWSITSMLFMGPGIPGNRVIGGTDEGHNAYGVTPDLQVDTGEGARRIHPQDVHFALRRLAGLEQSELAAMFPLDVTDPLPIFG